MSRRFRDWTLFLAAVVLVVLGTLSALEGSAAGFIAGYGAAPLVALLLLGRAKLKEGKQ